MPEELILHFKPGDKVRIKEGSFEQYAIFNGVTGVVLSCDVDSDMVRVKTNIYSERDFPDGLLPIASYLLEPAENGIDRARKVLKCRK